MLLKEPIEGLNASANDLQRRSSVSSRVLRPTKAMLARMASIQEDKENKRRERQRETRLRVPSAKKKQLTVPKSPHLLSHRPRKSDRLMSATSKELSEIEEIKKRVAKEKQRNLRYFQRIINVASTRTGSAIASTGLLQSTSVCGLEAIPHKQCTKPIGFNLRVDQRADAKKRKTREAEDVDCDHTDHVVQKRKRRVTIPRRPVTEPPLRRSRRLMMRL